MAILNCSTGSTIPSSGTATFTFSSSYYYVAAAIIVYAIDGNGNRIGYALDPSTVGGNWSSGDSAGRIIRLGPGASSSPMYRTSVSINVDTFKTYVTASNLAGIQLCLEGWYYAAESTQDPTNFYEDASQGTLLNFFFAKPATLTPPGVPVIEQSGENYVVSWAAATGSGGSGIITYDLTYEVPGLNQSYTSYGLTQPNATIKIPDAFYDQQARFFVWANYSGKEAPSPDYGYFVAHRGSLTAPGNPVVTQTGSYYHVTWTPAEGKGGTGNVTYVVVYSHDGLMVNAGTSTSVDILIQEYDVAVPFQVWAYYSGWETVCESIVYYTATNGCIRYFNGQKWVECFPYYFTGGAWVQCVPYYYTNNKWVECN